MGGLGGILGSLGSMGGGAAAGGGGGGLGSILQLIMGMMGNKGGGGGGGGTAGASSSPWWTTQTSNQVPAVSRGAVMSTGSPTGQGAWSRFGTGLGNAFSDYAKSQYGGGGGGMAGAGAPAGGQPQAGQDAGLASVLMLMRLLQSGQGPGGAGPKAPVYTPSSRYTTGYSPGYGVMR